jgi:hypothetical protein
MLATTKTYKDISNIKSKLQEFWKLFKN